MGNTSLQEEKQLVALNLGAEAYGVDIGSVREIIRMQDITRVPRTPSFVEGVINLRGKVIPVVNLRERFCLPAAKQSKDSRIVVVDTGGQDIGMIVDSVTEVLRIPSSVVEPVSNVLVTTAAEYLTGIAKLKDRLIILLDLNQVLSQSEKGALAGKVPVAALAGR